MHSVAGLLPAGVGLWSRSGRSARRITRSRTSRSSAADAQPRPGEVSLAHHGVLFLDEMLEFSRHVLEVLRQPLEEGRVTIARAARTAVFPARFVLVGAMNPCPCGFAGDARRECRCTPQQVARYRGRLSGPLRDRIDLTVDVPARAARCARRGARGRAVGRGACASRRSAGPPAASVRRRRRPCERAPLPCSDVAPLPSRQPEPAPAGYRGAEAGAQRARIRPDPQGRADDRRSGGFDDIQADHVAEALQFRTA